MGEGNVPAPLPGVDDGSSSLAVSRVGEGKVRVEKKAGSPDAAADNIGREGISIRGPEKVEEAAGAGKICRGGISNGALEKVKEAAGAGQICREGISNWEPEKVEEAAGAGKICHEGIGTNEVFTPPPHSTWSLHGVYIIPHRLHVDSMEYVLAVIPLILGSPFHLDSTWNDDGMAKFHME